MRFFAIAPRNLARRPARTILTAAAIALAIASFITLVGLSRGIEKAFVNLFLARNTHLLALRAHTVEFLTATLDESLAEELRRVDGVSAAAGELYDLVEVETGENVLVAGWPEGSFLWSDIRVREGRAPSPGEPDGAVVSDTTAEALGARVGSRVLVGNHSFTVTGVLQASGESCGTLVAVPLKTLQALLERRGKVTLFNIRLHHPEDRAAVLAAKARLAAAFPGLKFVLAGEAGRSNGPLTLLRGVVWSTSMVALLMAVVLIMNTLLMSVIERRREIGILSTVGWSAPRIVAAILLEGVVLAAMGGLAGAALGMSALQALARMPQIHGFLDPRVGLHGVFEAIGVVMVLGVAGSAYPAWRAARMKVVDALRR